MPRLIDPAIASLDGYVADEHGRFDWPDEDVPHLASVDERHLFLAPIVVGGGKRFLPDDVRPTLELLDQRRFGNGTVSLRYRVSR
jgi:hypothetical protein